MKKDFIPIKIVYNNKSFEKPKWIKKKFIINNKNNIDKIKNILRKRNLYSVCEEASCPNLVDCFGRGVATFMILGNICTRKCSFCDVSKGRPNKIDIKEPLNLAKAVSEMKLKYVVITSVNRDDLSDGGAYQFYKCIKEIKNLNKKIYVEILVPDFRHCENKAIEILNNCLPDVFNHNIESISRLYKLVKPGSNYKNSLNLLNLFKKKYNKIPTKSGLILGLGETNNEIFKVFKDLYENGVDMLTVGQYLRPSKNHLPVDRYISLEEFDYIKKEAISIGFNYVSCGPFVRSSYKADIHLYNWIKNID